MRFFLVSSGGKQSNNLFSSFLPPIEQTEKGRMFYYLHFCNSFCPVWTIQWDSSSLCFYQEANLEEEDMHGSSVLLLSSFPPRLYNTCLMVCITHVLMAEGVGTSTDRRLLEPRWSPAHWMEHGTRCQPSLMLIRIAIGTSSILWQNSQDTRTKDSPRRLEES